MRGATVRTLVAVVAGGLVVCGGSAGASPSVCGAVSGNLVQNCGFETDLAYWNSDFQGMGGFANALAAYSGNDGLLFLGSPPLYQTLATTPGTEYTISFMVDGSVGHTSALTLSWGGTQIVDIAQIPNNWAQHTFIETASTNSTVLSFGLADSQSAGSLDDIIVTANAIAEPSSLAIFGAVLFGLGVTRRQRMRCPACATAGRAGSTSNGDSRFRHTVSKTA